MGKTLGFYNKVRIRFKQILINTEYRFARMKKSNYSSDLSLSEVVERFPNELDRYKYFLWKYNYVLPAAFKDHRKFFVESQRGFGEDSFHAMWDLIIREFQPSTMLEIGVYRGQTLSLWSLIAHEYGMSIETWGVSPLTAAGDEVSKYIDVDYKLDIEKSFSLFELDKPNLFKGLSQDKSAVEFISSKTWDVIYVDGSHDYQDVVLDIELAKMVLSPGGILVLDDASKYVNYTPLSFAFEGHPGPSKAAQEITQSEDWKFIGSCGHNRIFIST